LDAQRQGRVIYINAPISVTIEGLRITGGNASAPTEMEWPRIGGGGYIQQATITLRNNQILDNIAADGGGGLFLWDTQATLSANAFYSNTLTWGTGYGAGLFLRNGYVALDGNTFAKNTGGYGGGLALQGDQGKTILTNNIVVNNFAQRGGGLLLSLSNATLDGTIINGNTADVGGGLCLWNSNATLKNNTISNNTAAEGGGLRLERGQDARIASNIISDNTADHGGGLYLSKSDLTLDNNLISNNHASQAGSGLYIYAAAPRLLLNTIARNGSTKPSSRAQAEGLTAGHSGDGSGLYVTGDEDRSLSSNVTLTNTILVGHAVGISTTENNTVRLTGTLWGAGDWANGADWLGAGDVIPGEHNVWADPGFIDPASGDYHIGPDSAAINAGVPCNAKRDIDGDPRPADWDFDLGADERPGSSLHIGQRAWPTEINPGQTLTYTLYVTNVGITAVSNVQVIDALPGLQQALGVVTSQGDCTTGTAWGSTATCNLGAMSPGATAQVTLTARVGTTLLPVLPRWMRNTAWVIANEAQDVNYADTILQNCHVRLNNDPHPYPSLQAAIDASSRPDDVVKVAGYCVAPDGLEQIAYIDKSLTLQGGWDPAFSGQNTARFPTKLDARGQGRVLYVVGDVALTIEGLRITGGNAEGLGGGPTGQDGGGGVYIISALPP
jgi:hypothetical protein